MEGHITSERTLRYRRRSTIVVGTKKQRCYRRKKQKSECRSWADLHEDLLRIIKSKLCLSDQVRLSAVCKSWRLPGKPVMAMAYFSGFSWDVKFACEIYSSYGEKIHEASYSTSEGGWPSFHLYRLPKICASKKGWLLIIKDKTVSLYNPFSNLVLSVPSLGRGENYIHAATFSAIPTSSNCIIFVFYCCWWGKTHVGCYRFGNRNWTTLIIAERKSARKVLSTVYIEGVLYYVFGDGMLGCLSYFGKYRSILVEAFPEHYSLVNRFVSFHLFACEGQVLLATTDEKVDWYIFRYDESQKAWIVGISLGKWALFVGTASFLVQTIGDEVDLEDCICYFDYETHELKVYSLKNKQLKDSRRGILTGDHSLDLEHHDTIWIEPPNI